MDKKYQQKLTKTYIFHYNSNDLDPKKLVFWKPFSRTRIDFFIRIMIDFGKVRGVIVCDLLILNHLFSYLLWCFCSKLCFFRKSSIMGRFWKQMKMFKFLVKIKIRQFFVIALVIWIKTVILKLQKWWTIDRWWKFSLLFLILKPIISSWPLCGWQK